MRMPKVTGYNGEHDKYVIGAHGGAVEWQPGTGTRYLLLVRYLSEAEAPMVGSAPGDAVASVLTRKGWITLFLTDGGLHHVRYIEEKLREHGVRSAEEVLAVVALFNLVLGDEDYGVEVYQELVKQYGVGRG